MKIGKDEVGKILINNKDTFIKDWYDSVLNNIPEYLKKDFKLNMEDFNALFNLYINDVIETDKSDISDKALLLIKDKVYARYPLSIMGYINTFFMSTTRKIFRNIYPDSFDKRMNYLEKISQRVLDAEVCLAQSIEDRVNDLTVRLENNANGLKKKNERLIEFIDLATHELQSPLWSILGFSSKLQKNYYYSLKEDGRHCLTRISANVTEMHQLIDDMITMLTIDHTKMMKKDLFFNGLLIDSVRKIKREIDEEFELICDVDNIIIVGDPEHLRIVFYQLFKNSAQYVKDNLHGKVYLKVDDNNGNYNILIEDDGIGIEKEYRELVFKPMERLKEKNVIGIGMGLAIARRIIEVHNGSLHFEDSKYNGICIKITLPINRIKFK